VRFKTRKFRARETALASEIVIHAETAAGVNNPPDPGAYIVLGKAQINHQYVGVDIHWNVKEEGPLQSCSGKDPFLDQHPHRLSSSPAQRPPVYGATSQKWKILLQNDE